MNFILWITLFMSVFTVSLGQNEIAVEACISYNASEIPMLNIQWDNENVDPVNNFIVLYRNEESGVSAGENCTEGTNRTNISIVQGVNYVAEITSTPRDFCNPSSSNNVPLQMGSATAEYGYISSLDSILSDDNSIVTFTCHLACQTDFITGCNVTLVDICGRDFTQSCTVNNTQTFSPRQCSVVFGNLPPSSYDYTATVESNIPLQLEENILTMIGTFVTTNDSISCESDEMNINATTDSPVPTTTANSEATMISPVTATNTNATTSSPVPSENTTIGNDNATAVPNENTTNANSDDNTSSPVPDETITTTSETPTNNDDVDNIPADGGDDDSSNNGTASSQDDDDNILDRIRSLPVPVLASIGAVILIMIIVVILLLILFCRMKKSSKDDKSKETGPKSSPAVCNSFTFQNSTTALFESQADACSDTKSDVHTLSEAFGGNVSKSSSYDHLAKSFKPKQQSPSISHQSSYRSHFTDDSFTRSSEVTKIPQSYESSVAIRDEELLDDFDYDEIEDTPTTHIRTQYNNLVHSGKEHRLKIECPPAPTTGTYERLSQPPSEDNYAVPPELDDVGLNENSKSNHDYDEVPRELNLSGRNSADIPGDAMYDRLSPKLDNTYDQVANEFQYDVPANNTSVNVAESQYDTLLPKPKPPVLEEQSTMELHSNATKHQPSVRRVQHNPGPVTGDMYTVPKKFEVKSRKSSHDYDTVVDTFASHDQSTMF